MISLLLSRLVLLVCGTLYPAYASYKTVKTKNVRDYVKWMMYWIVFAVYTFVEIFADVFLAFWFPFYYELKIIFVLWLICPATRGSSYIFRRMINPQLSKHEVLIDSYIASVGDHGYDLVRKIGAQGVDYMIEIFLELFRKGQIKANQFFPPVTEAAQTANVIQKASVRRSSVSEINDEEFVIMTDQSEVDEPKSASKKLRRPRPKSDTETISESEDTQVKKIQTRSRRATSLRERKKYTKK